MSATRMTELRNTSERVTSLVRISHVTHMKASCDTYERHVKLRRSAADRDRSREGPGDTEECRPGCVHVVLVLVFIIL